MSSNNKWDKNKSHISWLPSAQPRITCLLIQFISRGENGDTPLVYRTTRVACNQILTEACTLFYNGSEFSHKIYLSCPYIMAFQFCPPQLPSVLCPCPSVSLLFIFCFFPHAPFPPLSPCRALACSGQAAWQLLHLKNINQCCCGDRTRLPSFIFFLLLVSHVTVWLHMSQCWSF